MPSPSREMASGDPSLFCINVGGAPGAWRLHEEKFIGADLLALQEINMTPAEWNASAPFCKKNRLVTLLSDWPLFGTR